VTPAVALAGAAALLALAAPAVISGRSPAATGVVHGASMIIAAISLIDCGFPTKIVSRP